MSANIPFEIQSEIIKRVLPVKSLLRFRSVSKQWKSLIDDPEFIADHSVSQSHQHHLLVRYEVESDVKFVSIVDDNDDSFPQNKYAPIVPPIVNLVERVLMFDSSHGLVCLYGYVASDNKSSDKKSMVVIWNPSIRKCFGVTFSALSYGSAIGFGVCPKTSEPKIVRITRLYVDWKVEVFTLSFGAWRSISLNMHLPITTIFKNEQVVIDGVIHWVVHDYTTGHYLERIIRFDLTNEEFDEVDLPDSMVRRFVHISKLNESLVVLDYNECNRYGGVWMMMKNGFVKLLSLSVTDHDFYLYEILGFRKNGEVIRVHPCGHDATLITLEAYEPSTKHISDLGICVSCNSMITWYAESLLLLNHSNSIIQGY